MATNEIQKSNNDLAIVDRESFVKRFDPIAMAREFKGLQTMKDAIQCDTNSVAYYKKHFSEDTVLAVIEAHLLGLNQSLNTHEKLSELQTAEIAVEIMSKYYYISIVEIHYVFRKAKRGDYGKINYAINMPDVLSWFDSYSEERVKHFMTKQADEHAQHKGYSERMEHRKEIERHDKIVNDNKNG
jgi:hypothetical protein